MDVVVDMIGIVKTNTQIFCKENIHNITKDWPGGSYLVMRSKPMVPGVRLIIDIGYNYNAWEVISFIVIDDAGSTKSGINYLSK